MWVEGIDEVGIPSGEFPLLCDIESVSCLGKKQILRCAVEAPCISESQESGVDEFDGDHSSKGIQKS